MNSIAGIYTFEMTDSYGDGWQASRIKVTVDNEVKYFGIPSQYSSDADFNASLEPSTGNLSSRSAELVIPSTAESMLFEFERGRFPSECSFTIKYKALDGTNVQDSFSETNLAEGEKVLSVCQ